MSATFALPPAFRHATALPRTALEQLIEELVTMLDAADGDPDLEDGDEDCCIGHDDDLAFRFDDGGAGDDVDAEDEHDRELVDFG
ncbi:hypothetical protein [Sphingosinicella sp.]|uniref:hypothetical protein n=1 Tax=Sphingosinicella sp. TaxID=1917971 RepID=UPI0017BD33B4|nr:hypothetical protein [Sphingosinicella sp.]MBA4757747.1 hypothetical protein [Sphingosinicella sp.]